MDRNSRSFIAAVVLCAVAFATALSAAALLHDRLHGAQGTTHECAATLISSGSVEYSASGPVLLAPEAVPVARTVTITRVHVTARLGCSILEHAPPAQS